LFKVFFEGSGEGGGAGETAIENDIGYGFFFEGNELGGCSFEAEALDKVIQGFADH